jgi:hypothetical protein
MIMCGECMKVYVESESAKCPFCTIEEDVQIIYTDEDSVLKLQGSTGVTNYRLYADLGLNHGNMNAWLKSGDPKKVSLDVARRAVEYLEKHV